MAVIEQRMVQPELAGVAFTVNPATGEEAVVIEACEGLADGLLAGRQPALPSSHPLLRRHGPEIERVARAIQRHFGAPQDIEFAIEQNRLYILQSRPITRIQFPPQIGEWTNADFRDGGVSSAVCTPLMWSLYDFIWESTLKGFLREVRLFEGDFPAGRMFFGRPYWNLGAVKRCLARLPGFDEREFDRDLSVPEGGTGGGRRTPVTLRGLCRALPTVLAIPGLWRRQREFDEAFLAGGSDLGHDHQRADARLVAAQPALAPGAASAGLAARQPELRDPAQRAAQWRRAQRGRAHHQPRQRESHRMNLHPRPTRVVALRYGTDDALPMVLLKGAGPLADQLLHQARGQEPTPVVQQPTLLDALYRLPVGAAIGPELFQAVATILAHVLAVDAQHEGEPSHG